MAILTVDFGSTFTKLTAIDEREFKILGTSRAFTTIESDIRVGFGNALRLLDNNIGKLEYTEKFAASSAGGGLKMAAVGLAPGLTAKAARMAANNAGAKVMKTFSYELSTEECDEIFDINPDIILLCGGTNGGNKDVITRNAQRLAEIDREFHVVAAGNKSAAAAVMDAFKGRKHAVLCGNVMAEFGKLDIMPAKRAIRDLFIERIIEAKGINKAQQMMSADIIPTPLAVFEGAELLSQKLEGLMVVDVGGATTDVYSMAEGAPTKPNAVVRGLEEPFAKRSVEGDLGLRYGMPTLIEAATEPRIAEAAGVTLETVRGWRERCRHCQALVPKPGSAEKRVDDALAAMAVELAFLRHCGAIESVYTPFGESFLQEGKDLSDIKYVVGVGGPVINSQDPKEVLSHAIYSQRNPFVLMPQAPKLMLDQRYIFAAMGLISRKYPELATALMLESFEFL